MILYTQFSSSQQQDTMKTVELKEITIEAATAKPYADTVSTSGTRLPLRLVETPQAIQTINTQVMRDQQSQNLNDVVMNMTNVISNSMYTSYTMRGFLNSYNNEFITFDGFIGNMYWWNQMVQLYNIENVEEISGPASALYSTGTPGGVINMNTKRPLDHPAYAVNLTTGSWDLVDASADLGGPLTKDKKLLYRFNIGDNYQNSFRPTQFNENFLIAPSLSYTFDSTTRVTLDYVNAYNRTRFEEDHGGLLLMNNDSSYNWSNVNISYLFNSPDDFSIIDNNTATLRFEHTFSGGVQLTYMSRAIWTNLNEGEHFGNYYANNYFTTLPDSMQRGYDTWLDKWYNFQNSIYSSYSFGNKEIHQTLLAGVDFQLYGDWKNRYITGNAPSVSFVNPNYNNDTFNYPIDSSTYVWDVRTYNRQIGVYMQDLIGIGDRVKLLLAGRYENFLWTIRPNSSDTYVANDTSTADVFLPRFGAVYDLNENSSVYASYCQSFIPQYDNMRSAGGPFPPQKGKQYEAGYKGLYFGGQLLASLALYTIDYVNILATDPADPTGVRQIVVPGLISNGAECTLQGNIGRLSIIAGYAYNHVAFSDNSPLGPKGGRYDNAPDNIANAWIKYSFADKSDLRGFAVSLGGKYVGDRVGAASNQHFLMPAYFVLDAAVTYKVNRFKFGLNGFNILDEKYVLGYYASDLMVQVGTPANWKFNIGYEIE